jgi:hypothetical protein
MLYWVCVFILASIIAYLLWVAFWLLAYNKEEDHSGDGGIAVGGMIALPFLLVGNAWDWVKRKVFKK